ncbi:MAG: DNA photolyase family protein [Burkholderiales bacterium]|nr:DNA photolyase family protein [Burkholderiales bacterium]
MSTAIVWFRRDLRLADNAALAAALERADRLVLVYVHAPDEDGDWPPGAASRWWLHRSLAALSADIARRGSRLAIRRGPSLDALRALVRETGARLVCYNRVYEPARLAADLALGKALAADGIEVLAFAGHLLAEPWAVANRAGASYRVYTPFAQALRADLVAPEPLAAPRALPPAPQVPSLALDALELNPRIRWDEGLEAAWTPGEAAAEEKLASLALKLPAYAAARDLPAEAATTRLSPHLHFGEITPGRIWLELRRLREGAAPALRAGIELLQRELLWREFAHHVLYHHPKTPDAPLDPRFAKFEWRASETLLSAWQRGRTGIPIVDAGMRELWRTGFMHNRVRMIVGSFLTKHLRIDWRAGARWFWDTLVDADLANNTLNWQWVAGCGADAAPYFRIFNPVLQSRKFDPEGAYLRRWLPELSRLESRHIHAPWEAPQAALAAVGVRLGETYPLPIVELARARAEALAAFRALRAPRRGR